MVRKMQEQVRAARVSEASMRAGQTALHSRVVQADQKSAAIERELMLERRRNEVREGAYEQQKADASDLSVENRMLLEKTEQLLADGQRHAANVESLAAQNVELAAEVDILRDRLEVDQALRALRPEDLAAVSRVNTELAESIHRLLPRLADAQQQATGGG